METTQAISDNCILQFNGVTYQFNEATQEATVIIDQNTPLLRSFILSFNEVVEDVSFVFPNDVKVVQVLGHLVLVQSTETVFSFTLEATQTGSTTIGAIIGYYNGELADLSCYELFVSTSTTTTSTPDNLLSTIKSTTTDTTDDTSEGCHVMHNIQNVSGSHKNAEWLDGDKYKFNRHVYIPINEQIIQNWSLTLTFTDPVTDIEAWVVTTEQVDEFTWTMKPTNSNVLNSAQDPWIFNFLGRSAVADTDVTITFCM